jgi:hypothetical protein
MESKSIPESPKGPLEEAREKYIREKEDKLE